MNKESKEEACSILAQEYSNIAKASGFKHKDVYSHYMNRCIDREDEVVAEQVMREAYNKIKENPNVSWVEEWHKERQKRKVVETKYEILTSKIKRDTVNNITIEEKDQYLMNYARSLNFL